MPPCLPPPLVLRGGRGGGVFRGCSQRPAKRNHVLPWLEQNLSANQHHQPNRGRQRQHPQGNARRLNFADDSAGVAAQHRNKDDPQKMNRRAVNARSPDHQPLNGHEPNRRSNHQRRKGHQRQLTPMPPPGLKCRRCHDAGEKQAQIKDRPAQRHGQRPPSRPAAMRHRIARRTRSTSRQAPCSTGGTQQPSA